MRSSIVSIALALSLCAASAVAVSAKVKSRTLTVGSDFLVGSTLVKKGTYKLAYDDQTGELTVSDKQKNVVARATVRAERRAQGKRGWDVTLAPRGGQLALVSLAFPEDKQTLFVGDATASGSGATQGNGSGSANQK
ncbi:MAG TPA: hypothetical protein VD968_03325 [Pyrinomonadaceae bacterium]|nr:hypothetical protein [Pyrinomonadaceae bacterium]